MSRWYQLVWFNDLTCLTIIHKSKKTVEDLVNKSSSFADFVRFLSYTYTRTRQFLSPLWTAIKKTLILKTILSIQVVFTTIYFNSSHNFQYRVIGVCKKQMLENSFHRKNRHIFVTLGNATVVPTNFNPMFHFYTPWKRQKNFGFLIFQEVLKYSIGLTHILPVLHFCTP